jgi:hypothetical protein
MLADALLRSLAGTSAHLRVTGPNVSTDRSELGLMATTFSEIVVSPVVMRKLRPNVKDGNAPKWELLVSASSVAGQLGTLDLASGQALFAMTLAVNVSGQDYLIDSIASNEAFGQVYLYRLLLREMRQQALGESSEQRSGNRDRGSINLDGDHELYSGPIE